MEKRIVYVCRHALAVERAAWTSEDDDARPLTQRGRKRFKRLVKGLFSKGAFQPQQILSSPLLRAWQSGEIISAVTGAPLLECPSLQPGGALPEVWQCIVDANASKAAIVGHSPDLEALLAYWLGAPQSLFKLSKGSVLALRYKNEGPVRDENSAGNLSAANLESSDDTESAPPRGQFVLSYYATQKLLQD